jgi:hypothetical protein
MIASLASSTTRAYAGTRSLAVNINAAGAGTQMVSVRNPSTPAGRTVSFRIWLPSGSRVSSVQPYALQGAGGGWAWTGAWTAASSLTPNAWNTINVTLPANAAVPLYELGVDLAVSGAWTGTVYLDSVRW